MLHKIQAARTASMIHVKPRPRVRADQLIQSDGRFMAMWGLYLPTVHPLCTEFLLGGYSLPAEDDVRHIETASHEFMMFALHPRVRIDFERSMFEQRELVPMKPAVMGMQVSAGSDERFMDCMKKRVAWIVGCKGCGQFGFCPRTSVEALVRMFCHDARGHFSLIDSGNDNTATEFAA